MRMSSCVRCRCAIHSPAAYGRRCGCGVPQSACCRWLPAHRDPAAALSHGTRSGSTDRSTAWWRRGLLAVEIALSFLLVTTSGLLLRTIEHIREVPLGFDAENRLVVYAHAPARGLEQM